MMISIVAIDTTYPLLMKEKKKQPTTSKKSSHNTLDGVEKQLKDVVDFDMGITIHKKS